MKLRATITALAIATILAPLDQSQAAGTKCEKLHKPHARNPLHSLGFSQTVGREIVQKYPRLVAAIIKATQTWHNRHTIYENSEKTGTTIPEHLREWLEASGMHREKVIDNESPFAVTLYRGLNATPADFDPNYNFQNSDGDCVTPNLWIARNYAEIGALHRPHESFWDDGHRQNPYPLLVRYELPALLLRYGTVEYVLDDARLKALGVTDLSPFITGVAFPVPGRAISWIRNWRSRTGTTSHDHAIKSGR